MRRVLHIMSGYGGGISSFIENMARQMVEREIIFDVITYDETTPYFDTVIQATGGQVYRMVNPKKVGWKAFVASFKQPLQEHHYDLVHCHIPGYRALPYAILVKGTGADFYIHSHDTGKVDEHQFTHRLIHHLNVWINRKLTRRYVGCGDLAIQAKFNPRPDENRVVLPNAIDASRFALSESALLEKRQALRAEYGIQSSCLVLGQIGRLMPVKNHTFSLRLAEYLKNQGFDFKLMVAGEGKERLKLEKMVQDLNLQSHVVFLGRISPIEALMPLFDVLLLPSHYEGLPTVMVEGQTMSLPAVLSDTITKEVDLNLGLLNYLSLEDSLEKWHEAIMSVSKVDIIDVSIRLSALQSKALRLEDAGDLYALFSQGKLINYRLGDSIDETIFK